MNEQTLPQEWMGEEASEIEWNGFTRLYNQQVTDLAAWFKEKLEPLSLIKMTRSQYLDGTDALESPYKELVAESFDLWLKEKEYELSYNQMCNAFFAAATELKKLVIQ